MASRFTAECSCGCDKIHIMATRQTADGVFVYLWSDASITGVMGAKLPGVPITRPTSRASFETAMKRARAFMDWVSVYDLGELAEAWGRACGARTERHIPITWTTKCADVYGRPTVRVGNLPRLLFPNTAIWHERGVYAVMDVRIVRNGDRVATATGFSFRRLADLDRHLRAMLD